VASRGREPGLQLVRGRGEMRLSEWGAEILAECAPIAVAQDEAMGGRAHRDALANAVAVLDDPDTAPSARVLAAMARDYENSHERFVLAQSHRHRDAILEMPLAPETAERFLRFASESLSQQKAIEAADTLPFESWRQLYLAPFRLHE